MLGTYCSYRSEAKPCHSQVRHRAAKARTSIRTTRLEPGGILDRSCAESGPQVSPVCSGPSKAGDSSSAPLLLWPFQNDSLGSCFLIGKSHYLMMGLAHHVFTQTTSHTNLLLKSLSFNTQSYFEPSLPQLFIPTAVENTTTPEKLRNLWHGISKAPLRKEIVFFIFMLRLVTSSVILSVSKEKRLQSLSMSHNRLLWLSNAPVFALLFNYWTHVGHLLFASVAAVNNVYSSDHHKGSLLCVCLSVTYFIILLSRPHCCSLVCPWNSQIPQGQLLSRLPLWNGY